MQCHSIFSFKWNLIFTKSIHFFHQIDQHLKAKEKFKKTEKLFHNAKIETSKKNPLKENLKNPSRYYITL
jgi:hypothetical protein